MENAAEAFKMAAWVLIFVLALSVSMNAFSQARQSIDQIILYSDREYLTEYVEKSPSTNRIVGAESIVPAIYRAYKENMKIEFKVQEGDYVYQIIDNVSGSPENVYTIDLQNESYGDENVREYILKRILFGEGARDGYKSDSTTLESKVPKELKFRDEGFYKEVIKNHTYEEFIGVYVQGEENGVIAGTETSHNKTEKKVITYVVKQ